MKVVHIRGLAGGSTARISERNCRPFEVEHRRQRSDLRRLRALQVSDSLCFSIPLLPNKPDHTSNMASEWIWQEICFSSS